MDKLPQLYLPPNEKRLLKFDKEPLEKLGLSENVAMAISGSSVLGASQWSVVDQQENKVSHLIFINQSGPLFYSEK